MKSLKQLFEEIDNDWVKHLSEEVEKDYFNTLNDFLSGLDKEVVFPEEDNIFQAFKHCPLEKLKVVIIGQDPYHGEGQAHGLSFSVQKGIKIPPSLKNIYKELNDDLGIEIPDHGHLENWAKEGVLLLNNVLTVEKSKAGSHQKKGWEKFTQAVIETINKEKENVVFILWGSPAQKKEKFLDKEKHFLIKSVHPSPLSSYRGFFGSKPFSQCNQYLSKKGLKEINWSI
ncbi:MAG: uracil-DNA glycosylase [Oligoflexia bacterium]|nr:uracil-DNA glycosylase [Oligoflexia bacterium]